MNQAFDRQIKRLGGWGVMRSSVHRIMQQAFPKYDSEAVAAQNHRILRLGIIDWEFQIAASPFPSKANRA